MLSQVLKVCVLNDHATMPTRAYDSAGYNIYSSEDYHISEGERADVRTGIQVLIPYGYVGQLFKKGSAHGVFTGVADCIVDHEFAGELEVTVVNQSHYVPRQFRDNRCKECGIMCEVDRVTAHTAKISRGDVIAQLLITPVLCVPLELVTQRDMHVCRKFKRGILRARGWRGGKHADESNNSVVGTVTLPSGTVVRNGSYKAYKTAKRFGRYKVRGSNDTFEYEADFSSDDSYEVEDAVDNAHRAVLRQHSTFILPVLTPPPPPPEVPVPPPKVDCE